RERKSDVIVFSAEISSRVPQLRKEFLVERSLQIAHTFRAAGAAFSADHALDHLDVMRPPQREVFVMFDQGFGQLIFLIERFRVREDFNDGARAFALIAAALFIVNRRILSRRIESAAAQEGKELIRK